MASTLKINTLTGVTTAGSIAVTGEGNSTTTNLQQGLCKAWVNFTMKTSTTIRDSFNVSGLTDNATGKTTVSINNDMSNDDYAGVMYTSANTGTGADGEFGNDFLGGLTVRATGSFQVESYGSAFVDSVLNDAIVHGDLA